MPAVVNDFLNIERALRRVFQIPTEEEERALARTLVYRFLCNAHRYPETGVLSSRVELLASLPAALGALRKRGDYRLTDSFIRLKIGAEWTPPTELEAAHVFLFGQAGPGTCLPWERAYVEDGEGLAESSLLADLDNSYRELGFPAGPSDHEPIDSISSECGFAAFLCSREAGALERDDVDLAAVCVSAQRRFLGEHLARWVPGFTRLVEREASDGFHSELARFTRSYLEEECLRIGVPPESPAAIALTRGA